MAAVLPSDRMLWPHGPPRSHYGDCPDGRLFRTTSSFPDGRQPPTHRPRARRPKSIRDMSRPWRASRPSPIRALFDVAGSVHPKVERARHRVGSPPDHPPCVIERSTKWLAGPARHRGMRAGRSRPPQYRPRERPGSEAERRLSDAGKTPFVARSMPATPPAGRVLRPRRSTPLIVEVHCELFHGSNLDRQRQGQTGGDGGRRLDLPRGVGRGCGGTHPAGCNTSVRQRDLRRAA
jgi:hypothetical protein